MRLALIHTTTGAAAPPVGSTAWRTCLREIHFLPGDRIPLEAAALTDADAYALLLEVVCGLRSPLIGETEVQAQFKEFLASMSAQEHRWLKRLGQRVLGDAKRIRHKHLQGFGAHSYGLLAARHLTGRRVAVVGTGALAAQVVVAVPPAAIVDVWGRTGGRALPVRPEGVLFALIAEASTYVDSRIEPTTLVVAAPIRSNDLSLIVAAYSDVTNIVDLRSIDHRTSIDHQAPVLPLCDLLAEAAKADIGGAPRFRAARADIGELARAFANRENRRPIGWDDVCA